MAAIVDKNGVCLAHVAAAQTHIRRRTKTAYPAMEGKREAEAVQIL
jgi:hypothetical protein